MRYLSQVSAESVCEVPVDLPTQVEAIKGLGILNLIFQNSEVELTFKVGFSVNTRFDIEIEARY